MFRLITPLICLVLVSVIVPLQEQPQRPPRQLPTPTDVDPKLTEELRQLEQQFCDAILHKDAKILERTVGREYTLRVADVPQSSLPRAIWMDNTLNRRKLESCEQHYHAARKLERDLAVVSPALDSQR